ncbi:MAG TPA: FAD-dependent oxidoreductase [Chloroflexota bacterium]|nr:FAD-dependent oxidoreductase [Chloroflexota bacterium]
MDSRERTAILGGGALGLTLALRLAQSGHQITLLERQPDPGGLASGFQPAPDLPNGGPYLDKFYHHIFRSDTRIIALIEELGLGDNLHWSSPINAVLHNGRLWQPYSPLGVLRFSPLPRPDRIRMAAALALLKAAPNQKPFESITAHQWLPRAMGQRAYDVLWRPLLQAKFHSHYQKISMAWFWARIHDRSFQLGYLRGGFQRLYDALVAEIRRLGGEVLLGHEVIEAHQDPHQIPDTPWTVRWRRPNESLTHSATFTRLASTLPTRLTLKLIPQLPEAFRRRYDWGDALGAHCLILALDRPLLPDNVYWLNVNDPGYPFLVLVEHTNYLPAAEYGGHRLIYLGNYLPMDHPLFTQSKEDVLAQFLPAIRRIVPAFRDEWVTRSWSFAAPYAQPVVTLDFPQHIPPLEAPLPDLWLGSMFQVYPHDRGQNYSIELAERLAREIGPA